MLTGSVDQIRAFIEELDSEEQRRLIPGLLDDHRAGVRNLGRRIQGKLKREALEIERINSMKRIENGLMQKGYTLVAGIDEAGRGPLSGPVVAAAVILPVDFFVPGINDSKKLSPRRREYLYRRIINEAVAYGIGMVDNSEIDRINILRATYKAATIAVEKLTKKPDCLLLDAIKLPDCSLYQKSVVKGDSRCLSVAAASIIAKVARDEYMKAVDRCYPQYNFKQNKGYGTKEHISAILKYGPCPLHRKTFIQNIRRQY
ncbi:MAG: ribonuclease HII [Bacillota bacterium]|nr:ribonuclease HII [Bacillota bacterium]MDD3297478.1 ribonuclease HII [Bacillota bacterium]MDD3850151.1 ribonuclease HII [Bacillota bacterium]MDD4706874.1 ribonuclease HII [Bacillota bacterium]